MKSVILGRDVFKNARSPKVWNTLYKHFNINDEMVPFDCTADELEKKIFEIRKEQKIECGLIASPLKSNPFWFLQQCSNDVTQSKSANFFRFISDIELEIKNFDGPAAVNFLSRVISFAEIKKILIIGTGPVARNIQQELKGKLDSKEVIIQYLSRRGESELWKNINTSNSIQLLSYEKVYLYNFDYDLVINCTPLGSPNLNFTPIIWENLQLASKNFLYFDVNYGFEIPKGVQIAQNLGIPSMDGRQMNSIQASMAFLYANQLDFNLDELIELIELI